MIDISFLAGVDIEQIATLGFVGLMSYGSVYAVSLFRKNLDSQLKFALCFVFAFVYSFVPVEIGNVVLDKVIDALKVVVAISGTAKLFSKAGGN